MTKADKIILANVHTLAIGVSDIAVKMEQLYHSLSLAIGYIIYLYM